MKILHGPKNVAGQASIISRAQRQIGVQSDVVVFEQNRLDFTCDFNYDLPRYPRFLHPFVKAIFFPYFFFKYDIFHFHYGTSLLSKNFDLAIFATLGKAMRKKTVMEYWGSDVIQWDIAKNYTLFDEEMMARVYPRLNDEKKRRDINKINQLVGAHIVGDYSLKPFSPNSIVVRQVLDVHNLPFVGCEQIGEEINIVHAPTNRDIKGTALILADIDVLQKQGHKIKITLVENVPHSDAIEIYKRADIIIDDVLQGPYGIFAMECMALGKPVLCRIDDKLKQYYKGLPIIDTPIDKIKENLVKLIYDPLLRAELGRRGREYVEKNHDANTIASQLLGIYEAI